MTERKYYSVAYSSKGLLKIVGKKILFFSFQGFVNIQPKFGLPFRTQCEAKLFVLSIKHLTTKYFQERSSGRTRA